jgi:putative endonuclease
VESKYKIYILYSDQHKKTYVGFSEDISKRLEKHNAGKVTSTKNFRPWRIVFEEEVDDYKDARKRELYYKSAAGRRKIKAIFDDLGINNK